MKSTVCLIIVFLAFCLAAAPASAEDGDVDVKAETENAPTPPAKVGPARGFDIIKKAERIVLKSLTMVVYSDGNTGARATLKFEPNFSVGGKVGLTYKF